MCVWSGRPLANRYDVDHVVPYAAWGNNDLWNLLPCDPTVNRGPGGKFDRLPSRELLLSRRDVVVDYWRQYAHALPTRFATQARRAPRHKPWVGALGTVGRGERQRAEC